ncbi:MAG: mechanosensitive ion channel [Candidatus Peribacteraceae bacterium]|nr:mechanosensitive ion channel [Candidatus Peribacteraceae bacterium]MBP9850988.1 mechanosensitive ion channel [Candidatus Peribacteraceae bacterium]
MRRTFIAGLFLTLALLPLAASAQQGQSYDDKVLTQLYQAYLKKNSTDSYLEKRIADERLRIRKQADEEVKAIVSPAGTDDQLIDTAGLPKAVDRQRTLVTSMEEQQRGLKVDLDILAEEEKKYYLPISGTGSTDSLRLTTSHGELLAKKAILEERINALEAGLTLQHDRLSKLSRTQWYEQFAYFFGFLRYAAVILGAIIIDRIIRKRLVGRIEVKNRRYLVAKIVTTVIYSTTALWLFSKLLSDYPSVIASLAIIGAGIAVALQDIVKDVVGWMIILQRRLYTLGDRVSVGIHTGDIIDIGPLRTTMLEVSSDGRMNAHERTGKTLNLPNSMVLRESVLNYNTTSDFMGVEMQVTVTYDSDWKKAETILLEALIQEAGMFTEQARKQQRRRTALFYTVWEVGEPEVHTDLAASGILFTLKFTVPIGRRRSVVTAVTKSILDQFTPENGIHLAYNTIHVVGESMKS